MKICLVGSSGGHLQHLLKLEKWYENYDRFWVTFEKVDSVSTLSKEKKYWCYYPTNRSIWNLIRNSILALKILIKEKPDIVISSGAASAVPFFYLGKLFGTKNIFIEVYDRIDAPTLTGKLVYSVSDVFLVQWEEQKKFYKKAVNWGAIF